MERSEEKAGCAWLSRFVDEALTSSGIDYRALAAALRREIETENIPVGAQLPSQRELARRLAVGRTTVVGAYNVLRSESLVRPQRGAGTWVVRRPAPATSTGTSADARPNENDPAAPRAGFPPVLADGFLPVYDVSDEVATIVDADSQTVWEALMNVDLLDVGKRVRLAGVLGALRMLPETVSHPLHGERSVHAPESMRLRELAEIPPEQGGWILLGERPGEEIGLGLVGTFWRPVIEYPQVSAERFFDFDEPGYAKTVYDLSVRPLPDGRSMLSGLIRTATTDEYARRWFRRYWTFGVGSGAHVLVYALLETVRETAERVHAGTESTSG